MPDVIYEASRARVSWILLLVSPAILIAWLFTCTVCTARLHARINLHGELPWRLFNAIFNVNRLPYRRANVYLHRYVPFRLLRITANAKQTLGRISTRSACMKHRSSIQWIMQCRCSYVYFNLLYNRSGCRIVRIFERTMEREKNHYPSFGREKFIHEERRKKSKKKERKEARKTIERKACKLNVCKFVFLWNLRFQVVLFLYTQIR